MSTLYESFITGDDSELWTTSSRLIAQVFTTVGSVSHTVTSVKLLLSKQSGFVADTYAKIYGIDGSDLPDDTNILATSAVVSASSIPLLNSEAWIEFTFSSPPDLLVGNKYAIVLAPETDAKSLYWRYDNANGYADGAAAARNGSWATAHPNDCLLYLVCWLLTAGIRLIVPVNGQAVPLLSFPPAQQGKSS